MNWWKTALHDTCSIITLDKILLERAGFARHFPKSIVALEQSFTADQLREETVRRMRQRVTICRLPTSAELNAILSSGTLSRALAEVDKLVYAVALHRQLGVVTADKPLARALKAKGVHVGNVAVILQELVVAKKLSIRGCESLLVALVARNEFLLATPTWADLRDHSFPD
jgi:hypothetical protein